MERNEDDVEEIERLNGKVDELRWEILDLREEIADAQVAVEFREAVRDVVGLGWDVSDERVLQVIRGFVSRTDPTLAMSDRMSPAPDPTLASKMGVDRVGGGGHGAEGPVVHDPD